MHVCTDLLEQKPTRMGLGGSKGTGAQCTVLAKPFTRQNICKANGCLILVNMGMGDILHINLMRGTLKDLHLMSACPPYPYLPKLSNRLLCTYFVW